MKWNGRYYRPGYGIPVYPKKEQSIADLLKPLGEKEDKGNVWRPILNQPINVYKEPSTPLPPISPTPTPSFTPTQTPTPTPTPSSTPPSQLILDNYGSAKVGYSVRKLSTSSTYSMTVRRSNDNATLDIGFVGEDLDINALTGFVTTNSAFVTKWYDQSGNGNDLIQSDTTKQPRIVNAGVVEIAPNSLPGLRFDGSNDVFDLTTAFNTVNTMTETYVFNRATANINTVGLTQVASTNPFLSLWASIDNNIYFRPGTNAGVNRIVGTLTGGFYLWSLFQSNLWSLSLNTTDYANASYTGSGLQLTGFGGRTGTFSNGLSQEYILWESDQSSNKTGIRTNQSTYYNL